MVVAHPTRLGSVVAPTPVTVQSPKWHTVAAGAAAGAIDCCVTMPMDTMSTQMQLKGYRSPVECTRAIVQANGVAGLYAGFLPFCIQSAAKTSVRFYSYETLTAAVDYCGIDRSANPGFWSLTCGMGSGIVEALGLTAPTDRVKVMRQAASAEVGGGAQVSALSLVREHGVATLYRGSLATTLRQSSSLHLDDQPVICVVPGGPADAVLWQPLQG